MQDYITQSIKESIRLKEDVLNNRQMLADIETVGNLIMASNMFSNGRRRHWERKVIF